jgi:hypothetical protein
MEDRDLCKIRAQIIQDPATGLTIQVEVASDGTSRVHLFGECLECGNRSFAFDTAGNILARVTALQFQDHHSVPVDIDSL